ncbi:MAG: VacJ family lipoprotein [Desulfohalobiaceae bacterium]|nr:VacJ family lipoprotein [Desulfohalobiaceae bacterium]
MCSIRSRQSHFQAKEASSRACPWSGFFVGIVCCVILVLAVPVRAEQEDNGSGASAEDELLSELQQDYASQPGVADPLEPYNRAVFRFNDGLYTYVLIPVSDGYKAVVPEPFRQGMDNVFYNVRFPGRMVNHLLQGRPLRSGQEIAGFVINTLFGFGGLLDPADSISWLSPPEKDTGTTLATWGVGQGVYIVWPVLGPSTLRSSAGMVGDYFLDPLLYLEDEQLGWWLTGADNLNNLPSMMGRYQDMKDFGIEPYSSVKDGYIQYRRNKIRK